MAAGERTRVWLDPDYDVQHFTAPPRDDTAHEWEGETSCGRTGSLHWIVPEQVDDTHTCLECVATDGRTPPLEGDHLGPV